MNTSYSESNNKLTDLLSLNKKENSIDFSFIFFSDATQNPKKKYQLVLDVAQFADQHKFTAVWLPERHFHPFGGIYPSPVTLAAALAVQTKHIRLRSGSVVLPLHHPTEVVETWSIVDNLSNGRVDLGFASGWNPNDFISCPENFSKRREIWHERIAMVKQLWRGESCTFINGNQKSISVRTYPEPLQPEITIWLVVTKLDESFYEAGKCGYHVLTMLQGIDLQELGRKIAIYRNARAEHGFDPATGIVTLMLHTLVHENASLVEHAVREPFSQYIKSALTGHIQGMKEGEKPSEKEIDKIVEYSFERYSKTGALFGPVSEVKQVVDQAISVGVNEIACLLDFGVDYSLVIESLSYLQLLKERYR